MPAEIDLTNSERACVLLYATLVSWTAVVVADFAAARFCDCASLREASGPAGSRADSRGE
jgi:hypothetical protein